MGLNEIELFQKIAEPLTGPRRVGSWLELSRRSGIQEDKLKRLIDKWEGSYRTKLIAICDDDHRLELADLGGNLLPLAVQWTALTNQRELLAETVKIQAHPDVTASIFPAALPSFLEVYGGLVHLRIGPLGDSVRKTVANGFASFAIDLAEEGEIVPPAEELGPRLPWILLISDKHRLRDLDDAASCEVVRNQGRVFVSSMAMANPAVSAFLAGVPLADQIECEAVQEMVAADLGGVGISLDLQGNQPVAGLTKIALKGVEPAQLRFVLPRRGASILSEPTQALIAAIRKVVEMRFAAPSSVKAPDVPRVNGSAGEHLLAPEETSL